MSLTGYVAKNGNDLSFIFQSGNSGQSSGYNLSNGQDIGAIFATYTSYLAQPTGLFSSNGSDINTLFNGRSYIPLSIANCCLWLDAADITTITKDSSNRVSTWRDKSPNAFSFTQSTDGYKPIYSINTQNGNATIAFTSGNYQYLVCQSPFAIESGSSFALFVVGRYNDATSTMCMFAKSRYTGQTGRFFINRDTGLLYIRYIPSSGILLDTVTENYTTGAYRMFELILNRGAGCIIMLTKMVPYYRVNNQLIHIILIMETIC